MFSVDHIFLKCLYYKCAYVKAQSQTLLCQSFSCLFQMIIVILIKRVNYNDCLDFIFVRMNRVYAVC